MKIPALILLPLLAAPSYAQLAAKGRLLLEDNFKQPAVYTGEFQPVTAGWRVRAWHGEWKPGTTFPIARLLDKAGAIIDEFEYGKRVGAGRAKPVDFRRLTLNYAMPLIDRVEVTLSAER